MPGRELCGAIKKIGSIGVSPALPSPRTLERARKGLLSELPYLFELIYSAYFQAYKRNLLTLKSVSPVRLDMNKVGW